MTPNSSADNVSHHVNKVHGMIDDLIEHLREDIGKIDEPQARAMFETGAEVLIGLRTAFEDYQKKSEEAWEE